MLTKKMYYKIVIPLLILIHGRKIAEDIMEWYFVRAEFSHDSKRRAEFFLIAETMEKYLR